MKKEVFFGRFIQILQNEKEKHDFIDIHDALIYWFGANFLRIDPDEVQERIVRDSHAEGVDAVLIDNASYELIFLQAATVDKFQNTKRQFPENELKKTLLGIRLLLGDYKNKITPELENLVDEYHELANTGDYTTKIIFLFMMEEPKDTKFIDEFKKDFPQIKIELIDINKLYDFFVNTYLTLRDPPPDKISFQVLFNILKKNYPRKSRIFTCRSKELARVYDEYGERIFQQNVRYSLGLRSKSINREIMETAISDKRSKDFWYFNNGITMICKEINEPPSGKVINIRSAQIINGAQTTYALHEAYQKGDLSDDTEILIKVVETDDVEFIENVTLYTNSQNAIKLRDLCSNDEIQRKIQHIISPYTYFYERKRGELDTLYPTLASKREALGKNYKDKVISNENAAQAFLAMYLDKPAQAKSEKRRIFMKDETGFYTSIFKESDELIAEKLLMSWKLLKYIEAKKKTYKREYKKAEEVDETEKIKVYKYDFLLHSEYFILNIMRDFLENKKMDIHKSREDILKVISLVDNNSKEIEECYTIIKDTLLEYITILRKEPGYYHNKFFKSGESIGLVRNFFKKKFSFIRLIV